MIILGSTGSIGKNSLFIAKKFNKQVEAISANTNTNLLNEQIKEFNPKYVCIADKSLKHKINHERVFVGEEGILEMLENAKSNLVINALVGFAGLMPSLKTIKLKKKLALANKESLVTAGSFIDKKYLIAIDSEHFGLNYILQDKKLKQLIITASGGAFRDTLIKDLKCQTYAQALKHPNWSMGEKITIDSATMVNKLFEIIEAKWLFNFDEIDALIERNSLIHALIEYADGSTVAHFANADMKLPISYAILGKVDTNILNHVSLKDIKNLSFEMIDKQRYPIWSIKDEVLKNPKLGVIINAANEMAIKQFALNKINILQIPSLIFKALDKFSCEIQNCIEDVFLIDKKVREFLK